MRARLSNWLCAHAWVREGLPWKTHRPIVHAEKVQQKCVGCGWVRRGGLKLTWSSISDGSKTYRPVYFEDPAQFECKTCDYARIRSAKLWWRKIAENQRAGQSTETHICHNCYTSPDWTEIMPEGYEDVRKYRDLLARDTQIRCPDSAGKHMTNNLDRVRDNIRHWLQRHPWVRQLPWKTYQPLCFKDMALFRCSKCSPARYRSLNMWWRLRDDTTDETLCHSCYVETHRTSLVPEGYEDVETYKDSCGAEEAA
ncbi:hypothetical protein D6C84_07378 [Aureobasidium pullulans]|uniref:Uncharacterized protein n=1 Tax=Aureobasidium pullulans TaxID=5580 RepID=A0A4S9XN89_AURPU|nr:hypothetical protein D6C84_07378 [Aureobasidium pullulans]